MKKNLFALLFPFALLLTVTGCSSQVAARSQASSPSHQSALDEVRIALLDLRQAYSSQQMELRLIDERMEKTAPNPGRNRSFTDLEARIAKMESLSKQFENDLHTLASHAESTNASLKSYQWEIARLTKLLTSYEERLGEVGKLRSTLSDISKAISSEASSGKTYKVQPGDTLEKIARIHQISLADLKEINGLSSTRILVGQELLVP